MTGIYTFGHSTLEPDTALDLLNSAHITTLIDIRSHPGSHRVPQWGIERMQEWMPAGGVAYEWWSDLGGWTDSDAERAPDLRERGIDLAPYFHKGFPRQRVTRNIGYNVDLACPVHGGYKRAGICICEQRRSGPIWGVLGFADYQFYMTSDRYLAAIDALADRGRSDTVAICCCEILWWACHRSMVADCLWVRQQIDSTHLQPKLTMHSAVLGNRLQRYEPDVLETWEQSVAC